MNGAYFTYEQKTGRFLGLDGRPLCEKGYSGHDDGLNNPAMEAVKATGPIPRGLWRIGTAHKSDSLGPVVMNLEPEGRPRTDCSSGQGENLVA